MKIKFLLASILTMLIFSSCKPDEMLTTQFAGKYEIKPDLSKIDATLKEKSKEINSEMSQSKTEIKESLAKAKEEMNKALDELDMKGEITIEGKKLNLAEFKEKMKTGVSSLFDDNSKGEGSLFDGLSKMIDGLSEISNGMANIGLKGVSSLFDGLNVSCDFKKDGTIEILSGSNGFSFDSKDLKWEVKDKKLLIFEGSNQTPAYSFEMKPSGIISDGWILKNDEMTLNLKKIK